MKKTLEKTKKLKHMRNNVEIENIWKTSEKHEKHTIKRLKHSQKHQKHIRNSLETHQKHIGKSLETQKN